MNDATYRRPVTAAAILGSRVAALQRTGQYCFTLNGFPYGGFHATSVKAGVFQPTWADTARCDYTIDLATILAEFLPDDVSVGSISTLPLGRSCARPAH